MNSFAGQQADGAPPVPGRSGWDANQTSEYLNAPDNGEPLRTGTVRAPGQLAEMPALILAFSPGEKEQRWCGFRFAGGQPASSARRNAIWGKDRDEGGRKFTGQEYTRFSPHFNNSDAELERAVNIL